MLLLSRAPWLFVLLTVAVLGAPAVAETLHVDGARGSDTSGTGSRARPFATITAGLEAAVVGDEVRVGPGVYAEAVVMKTGVDLRGSGAGHTTLEAATLGLAPAVTCADDALLAGFRIVDPRPLIIIQGAVDCSNDTSPEIAFNEIEAPARFGILLSLSCRSCAAPWIHQNTIRAGLPETGVFPGAIAGRGRPIIEDNEIISRGNAMGLVITPGGEGGIVRRNMLRGRVGLIAPPEAVRAQVTVSDNLFLRSGPSVPGFLGQGGLVLTESLFNPGELDGSIVNNTFYETQGVQISGGEVTIANNAIVYGTLGVAADEPERVELRANDVFGNVAPAPAPTRTTWACRIRPGATGTSPSTPHSPIR